MRIIAIILGAVFGFIAGALIFFMPLPPHSVPYWIRHFEWAGLNRLMTVLFPHPSLTVRDVFFTVMGLLQSFIWAVAGACSFYGVVVCIQKLRGQDDHAA
jgi:hypothetical protein